MMDDFSIKSKRDIPSVEILASDKEIAAAGVALPRPVLVEIIRLSVDELKTELGTEYRRNFL